MITATIKKTNHADHANGHCGNANNCYYKGSSTVWQVRVNCYDFPLCGVSTKWAAQAISDQINAAGISEEVELNHNGFDTWICGDTPEAAKARNMNMQEI